MIKLLLVLIVGLVFESTGVVLLKKGMEGVGEIRQVTPGEIARVITAAVRNPKILLGVFFEALFFGCLLFLMNGSDISLLWPLTGLSFVFATFAAKWFLAETVSPLRWAGVVLIVIGAVLISYSEQQKQRSPAEPVHRTEAQNQAP